MCVCLLSVGATTATRREKTTPTHTLYSLNHSQKSRALLTCTCFYCLNKLANKEAQFVSARETNVSTWAAMVAHKQSNWVQLLVRWVGEQQVVAEVEGAEAALGVGSIYTKRALNSLLRSLIFAPFSLSASRFFFSLRLLFNSILSFFLSSAHSHLIRSFIRSTAAADDDDDEARDKKRRNKLSRVARTTTNARLFLLLLPFLASSSLASSASTKDEWLFF